MFPFHQGNELCFKISSDFDPYQENTIPHQDLVQLGLPHSHHVPENTRLPPPRPPKRHGHQKPNTNVLDNTAKKKMMHREIERQRRQEMAAASASLRSLLPLQYIKGKRSISDHMNEAANYIKHLQKSTSVLGAKRDELKKLSILSGDAHEENSSSTCYSPCHVMVSPSPGGLIQILVSCELITLNEQEYCFPLSRILEILLEQGLVVVSCSTTKVNHQLLHIIQSEVCDPSTNCIDLSELQEKLTKATTSRFSSASLSDY